MTETRTKDTAVSGGQAPDPRPAERSNGESAGARIQLPALTGNDLALLRCGMAHAINAWKSGPHPRTKYVKNEIAKCRALITKLSVVSDTAFPYEHHDDMPLDIGDEQLYVPNRRVIAAARKRALKVRA